MAPRARKNFPPEGHYVFPAEKSIRLRQTAHDPQSLQEAKEYMIDMAASKGDNGLDCDRLYCKVSAHMISKNTDITLGSFDEIISNGPFNRQGPRIIYVVHHDYDKDRQMKYSAAFPSEPPALPIFPTSPDDPSHVVLSSPFQTRLSSTLTSASPLFSVRSDGGTLGQMTSNVDAENRALHDLMDNVWDNLAFTISTAAGSGYPLAELIPIVANETEMNPKEVMKAIYLGPFDVSLTAEVSYLSETDDSSETRSLQFDILIEAMIQDNGFMPST